MAPQLSLLRVTTIPMAVLSVIAIVTLAGCSPTRTDPIYAKVIDAQTGQPLERVNVIYEVMAYQETWIDRWIGETGNTVPLILVELLTDCKGQVAIPAQRIQRSTFWRSLSYSRPKMLIFKSGYKPASMTFETHFIPRFEELLSWKENGKTIKLEKIDNLSQHKRDLNLIQSELRDLYAISINHCAWKQFPNMIMALEEEHMMLQTKGMRSSYPTILGNLLLAETFYAKQNHFINACGSPSAFFEKYPLTCPNNSNEKMTQIKRKSQIEEIPGSTARFTLYTLGHCKSDDRYWVFEQGKGWYTVSTGSLDFVEDSRGLRTES